MQAENRLYKAQRLKFIIYTSMSPENSLNLLSIKKVVNYPEWLLFSDTHHGYRYSRFTYILNITAHINIGTIINSSRQ